MTFIISKKIVLNMYRINSKCTCDGYWIVWGRGRFFYSLQRAKWIPHKSI